MLTLFKLFQILIELTLNFTLWFLDKIWLALPFTEEIEIKSYKEANQKPRTSYLIALKNLMKQRRTQTETSQNFIATFMIPILFFVLLLESCQSDNAPSRYDKAIKISQDGVTRDTPENLKLILQGKENEIYRAKTLAEALNEPWLMKDYKKDKPRKNTTQNIYFEIMFILMFLTFGRFKSYKIDMKLSEENINLLESTNLNYFKSERWKTLKQIQQQINNKFKKN